MFYPERRAAAPGAFERLFAALGWRAHRLLGARLPGAAELAREVREARARLQGGALHEALPGLRYRLRRAGLSTALLAECFALELAAAGEDAPPGVLAAAAWMARGGIAELEAPRERVAALALAALARALHDGGVHLLTPHEAAAQALAAALRPAFSALGLQVAAIAAAMPAAERRAAYAAPVVCAPLREAGLDYLRDRTQAGGRPGRLRSTLERLSSGQAGAAPLLGGLHCALVHEADVVMLDEARAPLVIAREVDESRERLAYEQAIELARSLEPERDFRIEEDGVRLAEGAAERLARVVAPLGGVWAARQQREDLVGLALEALHAWQPGSDYRVEQGRLVLAEPPAEGEASERDAALQALLEVKEGVRSGGRREIVARASIPGFLTRYLHLGGTCAGAPGLEHELWALYRLKCARAGPRTAAAKVPARVFPARADKLAALAEEAARAQAAGEALVVALRTPPEALAVRGTLADAGLPAAALWLYPAQAPRPDGRPVRLVIAELHDAARHCLQLAQAAGASSAQVLLSLEEERTAAALEPWMAVLLEAAAAGRKELPPRLAALAARLAQRGAERAQAALRQELASREQQLRDLLAFSGEAD